MDSDDQVSVCSEILSVSSKSLNYEDNESSTCDSIITTFQRCNVKVEDFEKIPLSPVTEEIEELDFTNDSVVELSLVQISSPSHSDKTMETIAAPVCCNNEEPKTRDNSTNTENYGYKGKMFRQTSSSNFKNRPYGYNHKRPYQYNNYRRNYYQRPLYNNYQQKQFSYMNYYQNRNFCNKWDCQMRHRQNEQFRNMLFTGIFHFTKFLEYVSQLHF